LLNTQLGQWIWLDGWPRQWSGDGDNGAPSRREPIRVHNMSAPSAKAATIPHSAPSSFVFHGWRGLILPNRVPCLPNLIYPPNHSGLTFDLITHTQPSPVHPHLCMLTLCCLSRFLLAFAIVLGNLFLSHSYLIFLNLLSSSHILFPLKRGDRVLSTVTLGAFCWEPR
jgi:hypothetical protein